MQTRRWKRDGEDSDRFSTEILLVPGGRVQFLDKRNGANGNGVAAEVGSEAPMSGSDMPAADAPEPNGGMEIPF